MSQNQFSEELSRLGVPPSMLLAQNIPAATQEKMGIGKLLKEFADTGIKNVVFDPSIVRGFDYYTGMVFEVFDTHSDNNRSLFGGGRYDNLTALFDDSSASKLPGVGFGMGDVTIRDFLAVRDRLPAYLPPTKVYVAVTSPEWVLEAQTLAGELRQKGINTAIDFGDKKLGDQIKNVNKQKIPHLIVFGENEQKSGEFSVKNLETDEETTLKRSEIADYLNSQ